MKAIVAADLNWGIGYKGELLERIPDDMKLFKKLTFNNVIIMGRKTFESLPDKRPLPGRTNIVMTRDTKFTIETEPGLVICRSEDALMDILKRVHPTREVFVIGGSDMYKQLLPYCDTIYVTRIQNRHTADRFFKNLDIEREYRLVSASDIQMYNNVDYSFLKYERVQEKKIP